MARNKKRTLIAIDNALAEFSKIYPERFNWLFLDF